MTVSRVAAAVVALLASSPASLAQNLNGYPDLRGEWKGTSESVVRGNPTHHVAGPTPPEARPTATEFSISIKGQEGRRYWGELSSKQATEPFVGVIGSDKTTVYRADTEGYLVGKLVEPGKLDICYLRAGKDFMVAACTLFVKQ